METWALEDGRSSARFKQLCISSRSGYNPWWLCSSKFSNKCVANLSGISREWRRWIYWFTRSGLQHVWLWRLHGNQWRSLLFYTASTPAVLEEITSRSRHTDRAVSWLHCHLLRAALIFSWIAWTSVYPYDLGFGRAHPHLLWRLFSWAAKYWCSSCQWGVLRFHWDVWIRRSHILQLGLPFLRNPRKWELRWHYCYLDWE